ncbi:MAG: flagellar basal body L-ring protein FlgH [Planctomycetota bacterium]|jgi:flagellar L-ring protein precursor FlgH
MRSHCRTQLLLTGAMLTLSATSVSAQLLSRRDREQAQNETLRNLRSRSSVQQAARIPSSWPGPQTGNSSPVRQAAFTQVQQTPTQHISHPRQSFNLGPVIVPGGPVLRSRDMSWIYIDAPEPREIKLHDIVTIVVDEKSEVTMNSRFNRQKNAKLKAELKEFLRIGDDGNLARAALDGPKIDTQLQGNLNTTGQVTDQEGIRYRIAATVADVLPNGIVRLEARKVIQTQDDVSEYTLTGELRAVDIGPDNLASSENIANLRIEKRQRGRVYDSVKRNWGYRLYDLLSPF